MCPSTLKPDLDNANVGNEFCKAFPKVGALILLEGNMLGEIITQNRRRRPLIHCITNYVSANDCANILLACGGSAIMADDPDEVAEVTAMCGTLQGLWPA